MIPVIILGSLSVLTAVPRVFEKTPAAGFVSKVLASVFFCVAGLSAVYGHEITLRRAGMLAAFLCALLGDIFLGLGPFTGEKHKDFFFILGSAPFLLAQLLYIAVMMSLAPFNWALLPVALALPAIYLLLIWRKALVLGKNTAPIMLYSLIISVMVMAAANIFAAGHPAGISAVAAGILFALSDTSLFLNNFGSDKLRAHGKALTALVMLPYYAAQALFALVLYKI